MDWRRHAERGCGCPHDDRRRHQAAGPGADRGERYFYGIERIRLSNCRDIGERTMRFIARAPTVTQLYLDGCVGIDDDCLYHIRGNHAIARLSLSGCINVSSRGLARSVANFHAIRSLSLNSCWNVGELSFLGGLRQLEALSLGWCYNVNDDSVGVLRGLARLRSLDISKTNIGNRGIREIFGDRAEDAAAGAPAPCLVELKLDGCNVTGESLQVLGRSRRTRGLRDLSLQWCLITDANLAHLSPLDRLASLNLSYTQVSCAGMRHVARLPRLASLKLDSCNIGDAAVQHLASGGTGAGSGGRSGGAAGITELDLSDTSISNLGLKLITDNMPHMRTLNLSYTAINDDGVEHLRGLHGLTSLNLDSPTISDQSLHHVSGLSSIRHLDLFGSKITDAGLKLICTLTFSNIRSLEVCGGGVTDVGVMYISLFMLRLESLNLANNSRISDDAMVSIGALRGLRHLNLTHSRVTGEGIMRLVRLQRLESLSVHECKINKSALARLQLCIPSLRSVGAMNMKSAAGGGLTFSSLFDLR